MYEGLQLRKQEEWEHTRELMTLIYNRTIKSKRDRGKNAEDIMKLPLIDKMRREMKQNPKSRKWKKSMLETAKKWNTKKRNKQ